VNRGSGEVVDALYLIFLVFFFASAATISWQHHHPLALVAQVAVGQSPFFFARFQNEQEKNSKL
jgi:hypothetical protein